MMKRERHKLTNEADSIEALDRGRYFRSSEEVVVMTMERREVADKLKSNINCETRRNN